MLDELSDSNLVGLLKEYIGKPELADMDHEFIVAIQKQLRERGGKRGLEV